MLIFSCNNEETNPLSSRIDPSSSSSVFISSSSDVSDEYTYSGYDDTLIITSEYFVEYSFYVPSAEDLFANIPVTIDLTDSCKSTLDSLKIDKLDTTITKTQLLSQSYTRFQALQSVCKTLVYKQGRSGWITGNSITLTEVVNDSITGIFTRSVGSKPNKALYGEEVPEFPNSTDALIIEKVTTSIPVDSSEYVQPISHSNLNELYRFSPWENSNMNSKYDYCYAMLQDSIIIDTSTQYHLYFSIDDHGILRDCSFDNLKVADESNTGVDIDTLIWSAKINIPTSK